MTIANSTEAANVPTTAKAVYDVELTVVSYNQSIQLIAFVRSYVDGNSLATSGTGGSKFV